MRRTRPERRVQTRIPLEPGRGPRAVCCGTPGCRWVSAGWGLGHWQWGRAAYWVAFAAARPSRVTAPGCEPREAWEELIWTVCALARSAMNRSVAGGMALSLRPTRYQDGIFFQAGGPDFSVRAASVTDPQTLPTAQTSRRGRQRSAGFGRRFAAVRGDAERGAVDRGARRHRTRRRRDRGPRTTDGPASLGAPATTVAMPWDPSKRSSIGSAVPPLTHPPSKTTRPTRSTCFP